VEISKTWMDDQVPLLEDTVPTSVESREYEPEDLVEERDYWKNLGVGKSEEGYDKQSAESTEETQYYPGGETASVEDVYNWPDMDDDVEEDAKSIEWNTTPAQAYKDREAGYVIDGRQKVFTPWHMTIFAIAAAIFIMGLVVIVGAAIRAVRYSRPAYRRLNEPAKV